MDMTIFDYLASIDRMAHALRRECETLVEEHLRYGIVLREIAAHECECYADTGCGCARLLADSATDVLNGE